MAADLAGAIRRKFLLSASEEYYKPYIKWWNEIYNEGLIDPELFIMKNDQYSAKAATVSTLFSTPVSGVHWMQRRSSEKSADTVGGLFLSSILLI